jgi:hypothetical protein
MSPGSADRDLTAVNWQTGRADPARNRRSPQTRDRTDVDNPYSQGLPFTRHAD